MEKSKIDRISELSRKSRKEELTQEEKNEQAKLRKEYIEAIRNNFRSVLDNIEITDNKN